MDGLIGEISVEGTVIGHNGKVEAHGFGRDRYLIPDFLF